MGQKYEKQSQCTPSGIQQLSLSVTYYRTNFAYFLYPCYKKYLSNILFLYVKRFEYIIVIYILQSEKFS